MIKIGLAVPTYNRLDLLKQLIQSVDPRIEIFISSHSTEFPEGYKEKYSNTLLSESPKKLEMFENWNRALSLVSSEVDYVALTSDDDIYYSNIYEFLIREFTANPEVDVFIFGHNIINGTNEVLGNYIPENAKYKNPNGFYIQEKGMDARMPSIFFKKSFLDELGYFKQSKFKTTAADAEFYQRALLTGVAKFNSKIISGYRVWDNSFTNKTMGTEVWLSEIDIWTQEIQNLGKQILPPTFNWNAYRDDIYLDNLAGGVWNLLINSGYKEAYKFYKKSRKRGDANFKKEWDLYFLLFKARIKKRLNR